MKKTFQYLVLSFAIWCGAAFAEDGPSPQPKSIPKTRSETKKVLGSLKERSPRLPVPETVPGGTNPASSNVINGRARRYYLPESWLQAERWGNEAQSKVSYELKTQCFWVVSRGNNCHYCLGHQEHKLKVAGLTDDQIGALDRNWELLDPRTRKGVELARKMTVLPFAISDRDLAAMKSEYSDAEIVELVYSIARFNSMNRWTDSMGLPQDSEMRGEHIEFDSPTESKWDQGDSLVVAGPDIVRPLPWTWDECQKQFQVAATRSPRVELVSNESAAEILKQDPSKTNDWHRVIATLPAAGPEMVQAWTAMLSDTELDPKIKAAICWTTARCNRSAGSLSMARQFAKQLGISEQEMQLWDSRGQANLPAGLAKAIRFADKLTCQPTKITDADIAELRKDFSDRQTAHVIYTAATANALDRLTETLQLAVPN
ncbi:MAG: carboxymuconolactone decarboxylase family protein [Planctomycetota bacterium]